MAGGGVGDYRRLTGGLAIVVASICSSSPDSFCSKSENRQNLLQQELLSMKTCNHYAFCLT
jgi:hypothetical protein